MKMKLYCNRTSPHSRKVRVTIVELGIESLVEEIDVNPFNDDPELLAVSPFSTIPALVTEHGEILPGGRLIFGYLLSRGRGLAMLPHGSNRWKLLRRLQLGDGLIDAAVAAHLEKLRPPGFIYQSFIDREVAAIRRGLDTLETEAEQLRTAGEIGSSEISIGVALGYLDLRFAELDWRKGRKGLAEWHDVFSKRASMLATRPPGAE
jgi:glutathione S-transferase